LIRCDPRQVLPFSTGVIMEPLPVERIIAGLPACIADLREDNWGRAAEAIMSTDTVPKARSRRVHLGSSTGIVTGIAKGAGMIRPDMATMLAFVATDATVAQATLEHLVGDCRGALVQPHQRRRRHVHQRFLCPDCHRRRWRADDRRPGSSRVAALHEAVLEVSQGLAQAIVRDGEGATKFITVRVEKGKDEASVAASPMRLRTRRW